MAISDLFKKKKNVENSADEKAGIPVKLSLDEMKSLIDKKKRAQLKKIERSLAITAQDHAISGVAMDGNISDRLKGGYNGDIGLEKISWYAGQSFLGYNICALIYQNWLVQKACSIPARDAARIGYEINFEKEDDDRMDKIKKIDKKHHLVKNIIEFEELTRAFGMRFAMMRIKGQGPEFYEKPFNIDGVKKGSFEGIVQIDPCWATPLLGDRQINDPTSPDYYEPIFWMIGGNKIHRSHLIINRTCTVPDHLKPQYNYGGIPLTQRIYERVYAAEITANEAPKLAMTKRTDYFQTDIEAAKADTAGFIDNLEMINEFQDNFQTRVIDKDDTVIRQDTSLSHLDETIMSQYQLVAAIANTPATKIMQTQPKGFNSSGNYEESSYHEELESIQTHGFDPFLYRYYSVMLKSEFGDAMDIEIAWKPLDSPKEAERAEINLKKAQTAQALFMMGAINGEDERKRIQDDKNSGYINIDDDISDDDGDEKDFDVDNELKKIDPNAE